MAAEGVLADGGLDQVLHIAFLLLLFDLLLVRILADVDLVVLIVLFLFFLLFFFGGLILDATLLFILVIFTDLSLLNIILGDVFLLLLSLDGDVLAVVDLGGGGGVGISLESAKRNTILK